MDLIQRVIRTASISGFVLVGGNERVYQRTTDNHVEQVSTDVDDAVHQLIKRKWLHVGGTHHVRYGRYQGPARSVLVPKKSRDMVHRWQALQRPKSWQQSGGRAS